ncbi:MAG: helix-turn-helix transcriptional regulator [Acidaminococcus sp.]|jgi:DNA-binding HxlR family transcriptional regulator|nr:helix-turn-helix transcriptional regulator [Acidaminococcus sp.]MCI2100304.1 helix-turn-helix transcriptional regulator [Acidaminococcus sp.]MCI2114620.1 helix-turn-helix transcriptional regulator [Acidaminococcus sp.]MCI2116601.1 helix-turn-helix transcriptional regulator [Acidaminococcus sp.]
MKDTMYHCPVEATLSRIGGKYKCIILYHLGQSTLRFSELQRLMPQATAKMLAQQLHDLEKDGIIQRKVYPVVPPKTEYSLTDFGKTLSPIMEAMCEWGKKHMSQYILPSEDD